MLKIMLWALSTILVFIGGLAIGWERGFDSGYTRSEDEYAEYMAEVAKRKGEI